MRAKKHFTVHVVGGASGLAAAIGLAEAGIALHMPVRIICYEGGSWGGSGRDYRVASPRCQGILHFGTLYASSQPEVAIQINTAQQRLRAIAPEAVQERNAIAVQRDDGPGLDEVMASLGLLGCRPVSHRVIGRWYPQLRVPEHARIYKVPDATMDLRVLSLSLIRRANELGIQLRNRGVVRVERASARLSALWLCCGSRVRVGLDDVVVLATGAQTRSLLDPVEVSVPGLTVIASHLLGRPATVSCMMLGLNGGPTLVPQQLSGGTPCMLLGSSDRFVVAPEADDRPLRNRLNTLRQIRREIEDWFGVEVPEEGPAWLGRKTEVITPSTARSQAHHCLKLDPLQNALLFLPGKLTTMMGAATDLARCVLRDRARVRNTDAWWEVLLSQNLPVQRS